MEFCRFVFVVATDNPLRCIMLRYVMLRYVTSVRANLIYLLDECQITEYWKIGLNTLDFLPIQNVRQYNFHDVAKYEQISPITKGSININKFRPK